MLTHFVIVLRHLRTPKKCKRFFGFACCQHRTAVQAHSALAAGKKSTFLQTKKASVCLLLLVGRGGFEPPKSVTTDLQSAPFGHSGIFPYFGAGDRNRTNNLLITNQLLCLLSYTSAPQYAVVPRGGLEPPTRGFSVPCYYQLSYRGKKMAIRKGLEPSTSSVTG